MIHSIGNVATEVKNIASELKHMATDIGNMILNFSIGDLLRL